ncbi:MAG: DUF4384 domain-containing protein [Meiothermus sp.]|uniref:DUF4384 domain-containing protein n=1 Tax=Meiothermus sp. TaxID=1955249 RepID=UPI00298EF23F|nr:DUF4384 domain-containing protein [Meiothermus sp.]MDW8482587.1 DUF4384 domain-containing protein [Meiothermus sp.]
MGRWMVVLMGSLALLALAAPLGPQGILVNPVPSGLELRLWLDRDPQASGSPAYSIGDRIRIYAWVSQDAYIYLFTIGADGQVGLILPNAFSSENYLRAGETRAFPEPGARYEFSLGGPAGVGRVLALASRRPLSPIQLAEVRRWAQGTMEASLPERDWVSGVVRYRVQPPAVAVRPPLFFIPPLPGHAVLWEDRKETEYQVAYRGGDVEEVFSYYHKDLLSKGWVKVSFRSRGDKRSLAYQAEYRRGGDRLEVSVTPRGGELVVRLEWGK